MIAIFVFNFISRIGVERGRERGREKGKEKTGKTGRLGTASLTAELFWRLNIVYL